MGGVWQGGCLSSPWRPRSLVRPPRALACPGGSWEVVKALNDADAGGSKAMMRYGNWLGPGWWGGSERDDRVGMMAPVDDLDATAQKHDFGYQIAEELGRGRPGVDGTYKAMADLIAIRDTMALDRDPSRWRHPAKDPAEALKYVRRLVIAFEDFQVRYNQSKSIPLAPADITDLDTPNRLLDGLPDVSQFEQMQAQRVQQWQQQYDAWQARKAQRLKPAQAPSAPSSDCNQGSFFDRTLCGHKPDPKTPIDRRFLP